MRSPGAPKLSFSCKPVSDFKAVSTVKAFFLYIFFTLSRCYHTHILVKLYKKTTAHTAVPLFPFLIPAEILNGLKFPRLQLLPKSCIGSRNYITNIAYRTFSMMQHFYLPQMPTGEKISVIFPVSILHSMLHLPMSCLCYSFDCCSNQ